jgi:hypothetical protein
VIPQLDTARLAWQTIAADLGFTAPRANGQRKRNGRARSTNGKFARSQLVQDELTRDGMGLRARGDWLEAVIHAPADRGTDSLYGTPGLWRSVGESDARARVFEIPPAIWAGASAADEGHDFDEEPGAESRALGALLDWAEATADGEVPSNWRAPAREEVDSWLASRRLVARAEAHVAQAEVACEPGRLAIAFTALVKPRQALGSAREAWLRALCRDTEERWRFVRVGVDDRDGGVFAEVDLTGVPAECARPLAQLSFEALICAVEWVFPSLALVIDPSVESRVLDRHPAIHSGQHAIGATEPRKQEE